MRPAGNTRVTVTAPGTASKTIGVPARAVPPIAVGPCHPVERANVSSTTFPDASMNTTSA